jgi:hypothetical protein
MNNSMASRRMKLIFPIDGTLDEQIEWWNEFDDCGEEFDDFHNEYDDEEDEEESGDVKW